MASTDAKPVAIKNQAFRVTFPLYDADGDLVTAAGSLDSEISKDGGTFTDCTNEATEIATSSGMYYLDLTATEMNADTVAIKISSTGAKELPLVFYPKEVGDIPVDVESISGDTTAADNLELQYDTTGLSGDTFPATQSQIGNISAVGAAVNATASSYVLTTGTQSANLYTDTAPLDGVRHTHTDNAGAMELYYEFTIGSGVPTGATVTGYLNSANDSLDVFAYDWVSTAWVQIGELPGSGASSNVTYQYSLFTSMVGTGANRGKVRIRFYAASGLTSASLAIDQMYVSFAQSLGSYENGSIWIDTNLSNTNTVVGVDGTSTNPVSTIAAALTLSSATNLKRLTVMAGSSITLAATLDGYVVNAHGATIALGGQDVTDTHFFGAELSGICTGTGEQHFHDCDFETTATVPDNTTFNMCSFGGTITLGEAGDFYLFDCYSRVAGAGSPTLDMGAAVGASNVNIRGFSGGWTINNIAAGDVISIGGADCGTFTLNGADGTVDVRGVGKPVVDNRTGSPTLTVTGHVNSSAIDTVLTASHGSGSWTSGGLSGTNSVTITVQEVDTTPIVGCTVTVYAADNTGPALDQGLTDSSGDVSFNLDDGTYALRLSRYGYSFTVPETITVETDPDTFTLNGTEITIPATPDGWEDQPLRRQKVKYNSANTDSPLTYQRVLDGVKATPSAATITIYAPGNSTALVSGAAMTISGSVATYSPDTTTVASWPIGTGYRGEVSVTISGTTYTDKIVFDVVKYILHLNVGVDQLEAMDDRIASMEFAGSEDFERPLSAARDILCAAVETKVLKDKRLVENMILDQSQLSLPMRYLALTMIFESKNNHEQADRYRALYNETLRAALSTIQYDDDQDGEESSTIGTTNGIVIGS